MNKKDCNCEPDKKFYCYQCTFRALYSKNQPEASKQMETKKENQVYEARPEELLIAKVNSIVETLKEDIKLLESRVSYLEQELKKKI